MGGTYEKLVADILKEAAFQSLALTPAARTVIRSLAGAPDADPEDPRSRGPPGLRTD